MSTVHYPIDHYWIYHITADNSKKSSAILCYRPPPNAAAPCAHLDFYRDGTTIPASVNNNGVLWLRFHEDQFTGVVETLRREKPLAVHYNPKAQIGYLMTAREPVGDEELP